MKTLVSLFITEDSDAPAVAHGPITAGIAIIGKVTSGGTTLTTISTSLK